MYKGSVRWAMGLLFSYSVNVYISFLYSTGALAVGKRMNRELNESEYHLLDLSWFSWIAII
jgi:hypothetical protein